MSYLYKVQTALTAAYRVKTKSGTVTIEGPKWVKPSFKSFMEEFDAEDPEYFDAVKAKDPKIFRQLYNRGRVKTLSPSEVRKLDVSYPVKKVPVEWLLDEKVKPNFEWDGMQQDEYRYSSRHHEDVLKAFRDGGELDMPIYYEQTSGIGIIISGRHRVTYARSLGIPLQIFTVDGELIYDIYDEGRAKK